MKKFIVDPFPDEHIFSWLLRLFKLSGYGNFTTYQKSLGIDDRLLHAYKIFSSTTETLISLFDDRDQAIKSYTTAPIWQISAGTFLDNHKIKLSSFNHMNEEQSFGFDTSWHSCEACRIYDDKKYGTTYWHMSHQLASIFECQKHNRILEKGEITVKNLFSEALPHDVLKWTPLVINPSEELIGWQSFYLHLNELAKNRPESVTNIYIDLFHLFGFEGKNTSSMKATGREIHQQFLSAFSPTLLNYLFRYASRPEIATNIVNSVFANFRPGSGERHPVFLAALAFWQRSVLNI